MLLRLLVCFFILFSLPARSQDLNFESLLEHQTDLILIQGACGSINSRSTLEENRFSNSNSLKSALKRLYPSSNNLSYSLLRLCLEKVYDNFSNQKEANYSLWRNEKCEKRQKVDPGFVRLLNSLIHAKLIKAAEIGCVQFHSFWLRGQNLDFLILKDVEAKHINIQDTDFDIGFEVHNSEIEDLSLQAVDISNRMIVSRTLISDRIRIFSSNINDFQAYDFYGDKNNGPIENQINRVLLFNNKFNNFRFGRDNKVNKFHSYRNKFDDVSYYANTLGRMELSLSVIERALSFDDLRNPSARWGSKAYLDLSGTRVGVLAASKGILENTDGNLIPVNLNGFHFDRISRTSSSSDSENMAAVINDDVFSIEIDDIVSWLDNSRAHFGTNVNPETYYTLANHFDSVGRSQDANELRIAAKKNEWKDKNSFLKFLGSIVGYGFATENLLWLLIFIPIGFLVKYANSIYSNANTLTYFRLNQNENYFAWFKRISVDAANDFLFSIDRFFSPLLLQKQWDEYYDLNEFQKIYFYIHRMFGVSFLALGAFSLLSFF